MSLTVAPLTTTVVRSVSKNNSDIASGVNNTVSRMSGVLSIALMGAMILYLFKVNLIENVSDLNLPAEIIEKLQKQAINLGSTKAPDETPVEMLEKVYFAIKYSFVKSFNLVAFISAAAAWLSSLLCFIYLKPKQN